MSVVISEGVDQGSISYYEDPIMEQRALEAGTKFVYFGHKEVITVGGADRLSWLTALSTQKVDGLRPGQSSELLFLTLQGRIEHWAHCVDDGERSWLITEPGGGAALAGFLDSMRFALKVKVVDVSSEYAVFGTTCAASAFQDFEGESSALARLKQLLVASARRYRVWKDPWPGVGEGGFSYTDIRPDQHPAVNYSWYEYVVPRDRLEIGAETGLMAGLEQAGVLGGVDAAEALRIAAWRPRFKIETDKVTIPHELDLMRTAVHLSKGCYKGQETVARVHNLGHPPRRMVFLHLDGSMHGLPRAKSPVFSGAGESLGFVTSRALHHEMGPIALAVIKRTADPTQQLVVRDMQGKDDGSGSVEEIEEYAAAQETIVSVDAGAVVGRAKGNFLRQPPRRRRLL